MPNYVGKKGGNIMDFDLIAVKYGAVIAGVISFIITFFNKEHVRYGKNKEKYFDDFLIRFYNAYRNNNNVNIKRFFYKKYSYHDNYIPPYVNYLLENSEFDKLKKILIVDFLNYYPSIGNTIKAIFHKISKRVFFIEYCLVYILVLTIFIMGIILIPMCIDEIVGRINDTHNSSTIIYSLSIPVPLFLIGSLIVMALFTYLIKVLLDTSWIKKDMYTYERKYINKIIKAKEKEYNKLKDEVYFLS
jgi:hypothetical protein